jgi:ribosome-binding factor A
MNIRQKRLADALRTYASEDMIAFEQLHPHDFGMISVISAEVSDDYEYADISISSQFNEKELPHFLAPCVDRIRKRIGKDFSLRKIPYIRLRIGKNQRSTADILSLIQSLDNQYGLSLENTQPHKTI